MDYLIEARDVAGELKIRWWFYLAEILVAKKEARRLEKKGYKVTLFHLTKLSEPGIVDFHARTKTSTRGQ